MRIMSFAAFLILFIAAALPATDNRAVADAAFDELIGQDFAALAKRFSPEMKAALPTDKLPAAISPVLKSLGTVRSGRPEPQVTSRAGYDVFLYPTEFEKAKMTVVISINSAGQVGGLLLRPPQPEPVKPDELAVTSGDIKLPATLVVPEGKGPFPAVVLVHGSGPGDRDETVGANAPFKDLAEGLAKHGVASLRYVKRTRQYPLGGVATVKDEVIEDALNALALVRSQPNIDPQRVYLVGHSLGAYLAPRIANADTTIAGIIMLAGNARPILELAREQLQYLNAPPERLELLKAGAPASYWEDLKAYDPVDTARKLEMPILILQGERDYQVTMKEFVLWKSGLKGHGNVTFKSYPKLNHLFLEGEGKSVPAEYNRLGHIPDYVYTDIAEFVGGIPSHSADSRAIADAAFDELTRQDFAALAKRFSPEMSAAMPPQKLPAVIGPVLKSLGTVRSSRPEPKVTSSRGYDVFLYPVEFEKANLNVVITINPAGQVGGLVLRPPQPDPATTGKVPEAQGSPEKGQSLSGLKAGTVVPEVYRTTPDGDLSLWIHLPDNWRSDDKRSAIVFFFGGGWTNGEVKQFEPQAAYLASRGMVSVRADYRVFSRQKVNPDSCVLDAMAAMRWVRAHARALGIDPDRIVSSGGSSGGQLAACMGTGVGLKGDGDYLDVPYRSNAMVLFNPALDMLAVRELLKNNSGRTQMKWQLDDETARRISPQYNVSENAPATILFFGTEDSILKQLEPFLKEMKSKGNKTEVFMAPRQQHGFFNRSPWLEKTIKRMDEFLVELGYLEGAPTIEIPEAKDESSAQRRR